MNAYQKRDHFHRKAKESGFAARSVFKLEALDQKHRLFSNGQWVIDLGCAPGSWAQYVSGRIGPAGRIVGVDLQDITVKLPNLVFHRGDMAEAPWPTLLEGRTEVDAVLSDMAPNTSGIRFADQERSYQLCLQALDITLKTLRAGGFFLCKIFEGPETTAFEKELKKHFERVSRERPEAVRKASKEFYFLCLKRKKT